MPADDAAIGFADLALARDIVALVGDEPGHAHDVPRFAAGFRQDGDHVHQRALDLRDEIAADEVRILGPADLPGDEDEPAVGGDAVGIALRRLPAFRLQELKIAHAPPHFWRRRKRWILPVGVFGSASTNITARGYL